jgi:hypothetical protein
MQQFGSVAGSVRPKGQGAKERKLLRFFALRKLKNDRVLD